MADLALAILWHQHQPYYPDDVSGENPMPWVRLHGVKDYYGMATHLAECPEMRCTINLVPSLLTQIEAYTERGAVDKPLQVSRLPASGLSEADALYHPILPLLLDKKLAKEAMPDAKLPHYTGGYPEDAALHVERAIAKHTAVFGSPPRGMWPAEGSVCQPMLPALARHGIRWIATDEEVLGASTGGRVGRDARGHVTHPELLYRPYTVREGDAELGVVFRDHALSDLI